ncbi:uncharacterized protein LOC119961692 isoform X2 [Scyliorhinus canicula]|uniref:uncharacterized protein LOC119960157 isoform X3 n=1 Tax=Scyliorhinus canicula TaxID=7830 RepID=UPI0018F69A7C|nr:uncharacterized protein LOC119960157 isoform X3 [Scyliorhinus canicula]XP_038644906.1 uncharacterized protein LOC119961692 isoform X2 [Scyliorhinus canicula]
MRSITFLGALPVRERFIFLQLGALKIVISSNSSASDIFPAAGPAGGFKFENGEIVPEAVTRGEFAVRKRKPNITSGSDGVAYFIIT